MILTGENRSTRTEICPNATLCTTNRTQNDLGPNSRRHGEKLATNRLSYGTICTTDKKITQGLVKIKLKIDIDTEMLPNGATAAPRLSPTVSVALGY
jgi:hypothetical protein